ncbi:MAG: BON domain-containing protein [Acidobacteriaceae bacterium]
MKSVKHNILWKAFATAGLAGVLMIAGCSSSPHYADSERAVNNALSSNNLVAVHVSQDQDKGVMTLTGTVSNQGQKTQAEDLAKQAASTYTIADQIAVVPPTNAQTTKAGVIAANSYTDRAIESNIKAGLKMHRYFNNDDIDVKSTNGSVTLSGTARTEFDKREADKIAKGVPNVQQVVNQITVKRHK